VYFVFINPPKVGKESVYYPQQNQS